MTLHKLTAGDGYDYLSRQVARLDATETGHSSMHSYYTEKGERPGQWVGSGVSDLDGLNVGDIVQEAHMKSLFALGMHPLAAERLAAMPKGSTLAEMRSVQRLGKTYRTSGARSLFQLKVAEEIENIGTTGESSDIEREDLIASARTKIAIEMFTQQEGRAPLDQREIDGFIREHSRPANKAVAGYDLTFSPVKSVSSLWALADRKVARIIEDSHDAAVKAALDFIESKALYTRTGVDGVQQVETTGLIGVAFRHRDSRAGDPDLHTHVAIANKVKVRGQEKWLAIDGRIIFKVNVAASETYNTALERELSQRLGVRFAPREMVEGKRPVREIVGIPEKLNESWSVRTQRVDRHREHLVREFSEKHGRPPTPKEVLRLNQIANLATREAKHEPRSEKKQRAEWRRQAKEVLGGSRAISRTIRKALHPAGAPSVQVNTEWLAGQADAGVREISRHHSQWHGLTIYAEAQRRLRDTQLKPKNLPTAVDLLADEMTARCIQIAGKSDGLIEPNMLRQESGKSNYKVAWGPRYTSVHVLDSERNIIAAAGKGGGRVISEHHILCALQASKEAGIELAESQAAMVHQFATSGKRVQVGIAAAGTGKTVAMSVLTEAWQQSGGNVLGLAPSAAAAAELRKSTGTTSDTLAKLVHEVENEGTELISSIGPNTLIVIDEAGMAGSYSLNSAIQFALDRGASVRLIGDDQQLASVDAGGVLRDIADVHGAVRLSELHRFTNPAEGAATLALRDGLPEAIGFYLDQGRVHIGAESSLVDEVFTAWKADIAAGKDAIMLAPTRELVAELGARARADRLAQEGGGEGPSVRLSDDNSASVGDTIITRANARRLQVGDHDWVKNGDRWIVTGINGGSVSARHIKNGHTVVLPSDYVAKSTELGYASTVHAAQGITADTLHGLASGNESRQQLYTMLTRGKESNHLYLVTVGEGAEHDVFKPQTVVPETATDIFESILGRDGSAVSALTAMRRDESPEMKLGAAVEKYVDAVQFAARSLVSDERVTLIEDVAGSLAPEIDDAPAWPTLRSHLLLLEATGHDSVQELRGAFYQQSMDGARDPAAVLDSRLDLQQVQSSTAPLPWLTGIPEVLNTNSYWGSYLRERHDLVSTTADELRRGFKEHATRPTWAVSVPDASIDSLCAVAVWRAATKVDPNDRRLTGPKQIDQRRSEYQAKLEQGFVDRYTRALLEWTPTLAKHHVERDSFTPIFAGRLEAISEKGIDIHQIVEQAIGLGPLPDDHASAALWWRVSELVSNEIVPETKSEWITPFDPYEDFDFVEVPRAEWEVPHEHKLQQAALRRDMMDAPTPSDAMLGRIWDREKEWDHAPVSGARIVAINELSLKFFEGAYAGSWGEQHMTERFGESLEGVYRFRPGFAPKGWTNLTNYLRSQGVSETEMLAAGVSKRSARGALIDRFRDRLVLPIIDHEQILGFVARRNPDDLNEKSGPKYLNTMDTAAFNKGAQLYGIAEKNIAANSVPVLVEGPMDAIAVTLATAGAYIGVAPLGTSLTEEQAVQLAGMNTNPIVATDSDMAGRMAAHRDFWILTQQGLSPRFAQMPTGEDPASLLSNVGIRDLRKALFATEPLSKAILEDRVSASESLTEKLHKAAETVAALPTQDWESGVQFIQNATGLPEGTIKSAIADAADVWTENPTCVAARNVDDIRETRAQLLALSARSFDPDEHKEAPIMNSSERNYASTENRINAPRF